MLLKKGHYPYVPHLTHYIHLESDVEFPNGFWYEYDIEWMKYCDALLYIGPSTGADNERAIMFKAGKTIFNNVEEVPEVDEA